MKELSYITFLSAMLLTGSAVYVGVAQETTKTIEEIFGKVSEIAESIPDMNEANEKIDELHDYLIIETKDIEEIADEGMNYGKEGYKQINK